MSKISGQLLISGQFQDICNTSGISGRLGVLLLINLREASLTASTAYSAELF